MTKRAHGEGTITQRGDGRWAAALTVEGGKRTWVYGPTQRDVKAKLDTLKRAQHDGLPVVSDKLTVAGYLDGWLKGIAGTVKPRTHLRYGQLLRLHALPTLGRLPLAKLTAQDVRTLYAERQEAGLSPTTVRQLHAVLHHAIEQASRDGMVGRNVVDHVSPPRAAVHEMQTLSQEQARSLLAAAAGERLEALYALALSTGMRQGELLGLHWRDVDLGEASLQIRGSLQRTKDGLTIATPKTTGSRRRVDVTAPAVEALRRHRTAQHAERLALGAAWHDHDLVFANEVGRPIEAGNLLRRSFWPLLVKAGCPRIRFHDLRHTAATLMLAKSVHPKKVSEMLGHSKIGITLDLYSHVTPTMQREAAEALQSVLWG